MAGRQRLPEGAFKHSRCAECTERPATKIYLDTDTRWVVRQRFCSDHEGMLVDFSMLLQVERPEGWRDVARWSIAHANFHAYQYYWDPRRGTRHTYGPVNEVLQVSAAYRTSQQDAYANTDELIRRWRKGPAR